MAQSKEITFEGFQIVGSPVVPLFESGKIINERKLRKKQKCFEHDMYPRGITKYRNVTDTNFICPICNIEEWRDVLRTYDLSEDVAEVFMTAFDVWEEIK